MGTKKQRRGEYPQLIKRENGYYYIKWDRTTKESLDTKNSDEAMLRFKVKAEKYKHEKVVKLGRIKHIRLSEFSDEYFMMRQKKVEADELAPSTHKNDQSAFRSFIDVVGDLPIRKINRGVIEDYKARMLLSGSDKDRRKKTVNDHLASLSSAFTWGALEDHDIGKSAYISKNPFLKEPGKAPIKFRERKRLPNFLTREEVEAVRNAMDNAEALLHAQLVEEQSTGQKCAITKSITAAKARRLLFEIAIYTGMRRKELFKLQWTDFDFNAGTVRIRKPKNRNDRTVPLHDELIKAIDSFGRKDIGQVFALWENIDTLTHQQKRALRDAGIDDRRNLHSCRHTLATHAVMSGVDLPSIQKLLGHSDIKTTMIYSDVSDEHLKKSMGKIRFGEEG